MKRFFSFSLAMMLMLALMTGCGNKNVDGTQDGANGGVTSDATDNRDTVRDETNRDNADPVDDNLMQRGEDAVDDMVDDLNPDTPNDANDAVPDAAANDGNTVNDGGNGTDKAVR